MNNLPILPELTDARIAEVSRAAGEPEWLIERREAAWRFFAESVPPFWRRTDLSKFKPELIVAPIGAQGTTTQWDAGLAEKGVVFTTLAAALHSHEALVKRYLGTAVEPLAHKFNALHAALWQDGVFLYVPKDVQIDLPLLASFSLGANGLSIFPHNLVILERGASLTFVEEYSSRDVDEQAFAAPATEIFLGDGASVRYITNQSWGRGVYTIGAQTASVGNDASLEWVALNLGGRLQHIEAETLLVGNGARVDWIASTFAGTGQTLLTAPTLRHVGANTEAHMDFKTVVTGDGYTVFDGMIKIEKPSRATISRLEDHALHLSDKSRSDSIPGLKIDTNDVQRAGHASTSGQIDEEQLFYMLSRGIRRDEAIHMIVMGFFEPVLDRIPLEALRERATATIEGKI
ncbi:MAG: Fe-S cluster assembly protein SufD [Kouleothrix sp.]|nr:Fe-S cluster assembly protein SufD [Kouleothrix sp.]